MSARVTLSITRRMAGAVALVFAITSVFSLAAPSPAAAWAEGAFSAASENDLVALTNRSRAAAGRKALRVDSTLRSIARWRSKDMIKRDYFSHDIPGYGRVFDVMSDRGFCFHVAGENIGWNNSSDGTATGKIHNSFMNSSGHRSNILGKNWDVIGIGAYKGANGKKMWTVDLRRQVRFGEAEAQADRQAEAEAQAGRQAEADPGRPTRDPEADEAADPEADRRTDADADCLVPPSCDLIPDPDATPTRANRVDAIKPEGSDDATADIGGAHGLRVDAIGRRSPALLETVVADVTGFFLRVS